MTGDSDSSVPKQGDATETEYLLDQIRQDRPRLRTACQRQHFYAYRPSSIIDSHKSATDTTLSLKGVIDEVHLCKSLSSLPIR